jgi:hypothetical protein
MALTLLPHGRFWAVYEHGTLLCVTVYKKGARAVIDRIRTGARKEKRSAEVPNIRSA